MDIRINRRSEVSLRRQLRDQIAYLIATGKWEPGKPFPSVRELSRRLKVHRNTVSQAYHDLVGDRWAESRRGARLVVGNQGRAVQRTSSPDLDDLINATIRTAQERGFTLQQLRQRVRERLMVQAPDHILVVDPESGLRRLVQEELIERLALPVETCSPSDLASNAGIAVGALVACPVRVLAELALMLPKDRPPVPITYAVADNLVEVLQNLQEPSVIALVSVSHDVIETARGLLAPVIGQRHTIYGLVLPLKGPNDLDGADLIFCDSIARRQLEVGKSIHYRLVSAASLELLSQSMKS